MKLTGILKTTAILTFISISTHLFSQTESAGTDTTQIKSNNTKPEKTIKEAKAVSASGENNLPVL